MASRLKVRRRASGAAGAPASMLSGEIAYNMVDGLFYVGFGDDGSGNATSIKVFAKDDFNVNKLLPPGGANGEVLTKSAGTDYAVAWTAPQTGIVYTEGNGIDIAGSTLSVDPLTIPALDAGKIGSGTFVVARIPDLPASKITSGTLGAAQIPALDAGKITTGTFAAALIPGLDASKITGGTFDAARIPNLDASKIATGTIDPARLPVLPGSVQIVSTGGIAALTVAQQNEIGDGSIVTTTDGRRWVYTGSGSKTAEASYIELADVTPDWAVIANKPVFATVATSGAYGDLTGRPALAAVATSGAYGDLTGRPTLGTMAAQNANAVAITGGTIDGVTLDGGTF